MEKRKASILRALSMGGGYCPLGYIVIHTNIVDPLPFLGSLEKEGYVRRIDDDSWSPVNSPRFEITEKAHKKLKEMDSAGLTIPLKVVKIAMEKGIAGDAIKNE